MKNLLNPKWLILINTVPIAIFLFLGWGEYSTIKSLLTDQSLVLWKHLSISLVALATTTLIYTITQIIRRQYLDIFYAIITLIAYTTYLYFFYFNFKDIISFGIPSWMISGNIHVYASAALMPTLAHAVITLVVKLTPTAEDKKAWTNFVFAAAVPLILYLFATCIIPLTHNSLDMISIHIIAICCVISTILFFTLIVRALYIITKKKKINSKYALAWKLPIAIIFPLIGLWVNNVRCEHIFGDFSHSMFYFLTVVNGLFVCLPSLDKLKNKNRRIALMIGRCIGFAFVFYFFIVFLPFLPLSLFAIVLIGSGILMLTPLALFVIQIQEIARDIKSLKQDLTPWLVNVLCILSFMVLPVGITISHLYDKDKLNETLEYIYNPDYSKEYNLSKASVNRTLTSIEGQTNNMSIYRSTPYLESYYRWLVLDNLNLSTKRKIDIYNIFNGYKSLSIDELDKYEDPKNNRISEIKIDNIEQSSHYDTEQQAWISWIHLTVTNNNFPAWQTQYATEFELPDGCWISDYYLDVFGVRKKGILSEKKAATWIFDQIMRENQDPGILRYMAGNNIKFKVFPLLVNEPRYTGIEFIHKEPVEIIIDNYTIVLGDTKTETVIDTKNKDVIYLPASAKEKLKRVKRTPYYHFIVDVSKSESDNTSRETQVQQIEGLLESNLLDSKKAKISYVNTYVETKDMESGWQKELVNKNQVGGFFLDRALKRAMFENYKSQDAENYPIFIILGVNWTNDIWHQDIGDLKFTYPDNDQAYVLEKGELSPFKLFAPALDIIKEEIREIQTNEVIEYTFEDGNKVYLANDSAASIVINPSLKRWKNDIENIKAKDWNSALLQQGQWMHQTLYPHTAEKEWLELVKSSFKSSIMTPLTSYIVLENEAQEAMLKKKQNDLLSGNKNLDLEDDSPMQMSEPELYVLLVVLAILYIVVRRKKKHIL